MFVRIITTHSEHKYVLNPARCKYMLWLAISSYKVKKKKKKAKSPEITPWKQKIELLASKARLPQICGKWLYLGEAESIIDPGYRLPTKNA